MCESSVYLTVGLCIFERTWILSGIQFTTHFIEFIVVETKRFVGSNVHMILTRHTRSQRSSMAAGGKRGALAFYFSIWIWYMFWETKCRGESDRAQLRDFANRTRLRSADLQFKKMFGRNIFWKSVLRSHILLASPLVVHRPTSDSPLRFDPQNIYQIRMEN